MIYVSHKAVVASAALLISCWLFLFIFLAQMLPPIVSPPNETLPLMEHAYSALDDTISMLVNICIGAFFILGYFTINSGKMEIKLSFGALCWLIAAVFSLVLSLVSAYYSRLAIFDAFIQMDSNFSGVIEIVAIQALLLLLGFSALFVIGYSAVEGDSL